jgi:uncharacterized protein YjbJ (UPF0337 family)
MSGRIEPGFRIASRGSRVTYPSTGDYVTDGDLDKAKGNIKETAGDLTDDRDLKNEGKVDKATGNVKDKVGDAADKVKQAVRKD